jgi:hypothetical protein
MALTYPLPQIIPEEFVDAADWNALVDSINVLANPPACRVYHNANQSIAHFSSVVAAFNSERYDTDAMHDIATNNSRITINTAGLYVVTFSGEMASAADYTWIQVLIRLNGTTAIAAQTLQGNAGGFVQQISLSTQYKFAAANYIEVVLFHANGASAARNLNAAGNLSPEFSATWVGLAA